MRNDSFVGFNSVISQNVTAHDSSVVTLTKSNISGIIEAFNSSTVILRSDVELNGMWMHDASRLAMADASNVTIGKYLFANIWISAFLQDESTVSMAGNATILDDVLMTDTSTADFAFTQFGGAVWATAAFGVSNSDISFHKTNHSGLFEEMSGVWPNVTVIVAGSTYVDFENCSVSFSVWSSDNATVDVARSTLEMALFYGTQAPHATRGLVTDTTIGWTAVTGYPVSVWMTNYADVTIRDCTLASGVTLDDSSDLLVEGATSIAGAIETTGAALLQLCDETTQSGGLVNVTGNSTLVTFADASTAPVHLETGGLALKYTDVSRWDAFSDSCRVNITAVDDVSSPAAYVVRTVEDVCDQYDLSGGTKTTTIDLTAEQSGDKTWIWSVYRNPRIGVHYTPVSIANTPIPGQVKPAPRPADSTDEEIEDVEPWVHPTTWWDRNHWAVLITVGIAAATGLLAMYAGRSGVLVGLAERWDRAHPYRSVVERQKRAAAGKKMKSVRVKVKKSKRLRSKPEIQRKIRVYILSYGTAIFILWTILSGTWPSWFAPTFSAWDALLWRLWAALSI